MKFDRAFLAAFNVLARFFGSLAILAGIVFLVSACAIKENRFLDVVVGLSAIAMGIAVFLTKPIDEEQLARMRRRMGRPGSLRIVRRLPACAQLSELVELDGQVLGNP